jgi:hypothetical protein
MHIYPKIFSELSIAPNSRLGFAYLRPSPRRQSQQSTTACIAIGIVILAMTVGALALGREPVSPVPSIDRTPVPTIETAFAAFRASSIDNTTLSPSPTQDSCKDFAFSFLNLICSKARAKHATQMKHRVATFMIGHPDPSLSLATAQTPSKITGGQTETRIQRVEGANAINDKRRLRPASDSLKSKAALGANVGNYEREHACYQRLNGSFSSVGDRDTQNDSLGRC